MRQKLTFLTLLFALGFLIFPGQNVFAQMPAQMECCSGAGAETHNSCEKDSDKQGCNGNANTQQCAHNCGQQCGNYGSFFYVPNLKPGVNDSDGLSFNYLANHLFAYKEPFIPFNTKEIWQPPKIG